MHEQRLWAMSGYLLFFLPLLQPKDDFLRFHANQSLVLWLSYLFYGFVVKFQPFIGSLLLFAGKIVYLTAILWGMYQAYHGRCRLLPIVGKIKIIR